MSRPGFSEFFNPTVCKFMAKELQNIIKTGGFDNNGDNDVSCDDGYVFEIPVGGGNNSIFFSKETGTLLIEIPGVEKKDIDVNIADNGTVNIKAERKNEFPKKFDCTYTIDTRIFDISNPEAKFDNGLLCIQFSRLEEKSKRPINII